MVAPLPTLGHLAAVGLVVIRHIGLVPRPVLPQLLHHALPHKGVQPRRPAAQLMTESSTEGQGWDSSLRRQWRLLVKQRGPLDSQLMAEHRHFQHKASTPTAPASRPAPPTDL